MVTQYGIADEFTCPYVFAQFIASHGSVAVLNQVNQ
jgi:hypothetical protein